MRSGLRAFICKLLRALSARCCKDQATPGGELLERIDRALRLASDSLAARQEDDGAWRARQDSELANGHALTGYVLRALRSVAQPAATADVIARGFDFVETLAPNGRTLELGPDPMPYETAAVASALLVLSEAKRPRHRNAIDMLVRYLCDAQYAQDAGYAPDDVEYGGFGYQPAKRARGVQPRVPELHHPNLSATLFVIEALATARHEGARTTLEKARSFVERCQNWSGQSGAAKGDGGFIFSPAVPELNKAGTAETVTGFRSYGTMSANGLRLLAHLGYDRSEPRFLAAAQWLRERFDATLVAGDFPGDRKEYQAAIYYYYAWTMAHALELLGEPVLATIRGPVRWANELAQALVERQLEDGSWRNPVASRKESLLPIADMVSLPALAICRRQIQLGREVTG